MEEEWRSRKGEGKRRQVAAAKSRKGEGRGNGRVESNTILAYLVIARFIE